MNWTLGPWKITHRVSLGLVQPVVENADGFRLATVNAVGAKETVDANTRLIALAPELAEALRHTLARLAAETKDVECCDLYPSTMAAMNEARALLAKLEGGGK